MAHADNREFSTPEAVTRYSLHIRVPNVNNIKQFENNRNVEYGKRTFVIEFLRVYYYLCTPRV